MCRWAAYRGDPLYLEELVSSPAHSLIEQSHCAHVMSATGAMVAWAGARWPEAADQARQAVADHGCRRAAETARWALGYVALGRGDLDEASTELEAALAFGERSESIDLVMPPLWGLAEVALQRAEPDRAAALCHDAETAKGAGFPRRLPNERWYQRAAPIGTRR